MQRFDLTGHHALVFSAETPAGQAIAEAYAEAGARVIRVYTPSASEAEQVVRRTAADLGGLRILASALDRSLAKPVTAISGLASPWMWGRLPSGLRAPLLGM